MNVDVLGPAVFWVAAALKLRRAAEPSQRPIAAALLCLAAGLTLDIAKVAQGLDGTVRVNNLSILLKHCTAIIGVYFLLMFMRQVAGRASRSRSSFVLVIGVLALLVITFVLAAPLPETGDFADQYGGHPMVRAYWLVTIAYFALCLWSLMRLSIGTSRGSARREVRIGFAMIGVGVVVGLVYSALKITQLLTHDVLLLAEVGHILLIVGAMLIGGGLLYPVAAGSIASARRKIRCRLLLLRLRPAWQQAVSHRPGIVLGRPSTLIADTFGRRAQARLYRRVIEIEDAALTADGLLTTRDRDLVTAAEPLVRSVRQ